MTNDTQNKLIVLINTTGSGPCIENILKEVKQPNQTSEWWDVLHVDIKNLWNDLSIEARLVAMLLVSKEADFISMYHEDE